WLEADRLAAPFRATDSTRLANSVGAIRNERRQARENPAYGTANSVTLTTLYGGEHPYRDPLGPIDDLERATFRDMRDFCAPYYVPNNAIVALSGDFKTSEVRTWIQRYFGSIPRGAAPTHPVIRATPLDGDRRLVLEDRRARDARLRIAW